MKKIILVLMLSLILLGCQRGEKSINTNIISLNEDIVVVIDNKIIIKENTKVSDVINSIQAEDDSKQKYVGVTNGKKEKEKDVFYQYEFLLVISESSKTRKYYEVIIE